MRTCLVRQQDNINHQLPTRLLKPLSFAWRLWESVSMDYIMALPKSEGCRNIMVIVDRFNKYTTFVTALADYETHKTINLFIKHIVKL